LHKNFRARLFGRPGDGLRAEVLLSMYWKRFSPAFLAFTLAIFVTGHLAYRPLLFHVSVIILGVWTGYRWWRLRSF
jgi:hypothetical protein